MASQDSSMQLKTKQINNLMIVGTTHLTPSCEILKIIDEFKPTIVGLELCPTRFKVFIGQINTTNSQKDDSIIGQITEETKKKATENNIDYASDQKTAMFYALNNNLKLVLLDKDINEINMSMTKIPLEELTYLQNELLKYKEQKLEKEVNEEEVINTMKRDIPNVFKILVEERNEFIANKIKECVNENKDKRIIVFIGKGHEKEIRRLLNIQ
ncbi:MAG: TraB/GumN family protein [Candidatus Omnitrophica bacterium]|jgi:pheromone shutdown protein TraB|nr:TraB/GumN family protein [Candidatus Omnitrophota bacterium]